jgi:RNA polymerase subunit RPABC4/transcription elongation factor Spt4
MAMRPCKECGKEISTKADACPHCGAKPPKRTSAFTWIMAFFVVIITFSAIRASLDRDNPPVPAKAAPETPFQKSQREAAAKLAEFNRIEQKRRDREDTLAYACKEWIKKSLHDPGSATFEQAFAIDRKAGVDIIQVQVRARNAFNALRLSTFECRIRTSGDQLILAGLKELR